MIVVALGCAGLQWICMWSNWNRTSNYPNLKEQLFGTRYFLTTILAWLLLFLSMLPETGAFWSTSALSEIFNLTVCRHGKVFWSRLALCFIFWVITPLNRSLLTTQNVTRDIETSCKPLKKLLPVNDQKASISPSFLYTSYGVTWLGEKVHLFMTKELIAIPFKPVMHGGGQDDLT